jgi:hypothetical protein
VREDSVEVQESKNPSRVRKEKKDQEGQRLYMHSMTHSRRVRGDKAKVEAFGNVKFFQVWEDSTTTQEERRQPSDQPKEEIWTIEFILPEGASEEARRRGERHPSDLTRKSHKPLDREELRTD